MSELTDGTEIPNATNSRVCVTIEGGVVYLSASPGVEIIMIDHAANVTGTDGKYYFEGDVVPADPFLTDDERMKRVPVEYRDLPYVEPAQY